MKPSPETIERALELNFEPPLDEGIRDIVHVLIANGVEAFESCEGGRGHSYAEPTVRFLGSSGEGFSALSVALDHALPVKELSRSWEIVDKAISGPCWVLTFWPPKDSQQWHDRDTTARYAAQASARANPGQKLVQADYRPWLFRRVQSLQRG